MNKELKWQDVKKNIQIGQIVRGKVKSHEMYGIYIDIGVEFPCFVDRINISDDETIALENYPKIGEEIKGKVLELRESINDDNIWREIIIDMRPSQL